MDLVMHTSRVDDLILTVLTKIMMMTKINQYHGGKEELQCHSH